MERVESETSPNGEFIVTKVAIERARSERARSQELRARSELVSARTVETLLQVEGCAFGESGGSFSLRLPCVRPAVALLRHCLGGWLDHRGVDRARAREIVLACSEACANAVEHPVASSDGAFEVEAKHRRGEIVIVVRDSGRWRSRSSSETRGRGMTVIRALMTEVEIVQGRDGTEIVMRCRI